MMRWRLFLLLLSLLLLSGCGFKDLDKRFFVMAIGIDKSDRADKTYKVSLKLAIPSAKIEPGFESFQVISQEADTIAEAVRMLKSKVDKELDFGHTKMFLIGESLAKVNIRDPIEWLTRRRDIQLIGYMGVGSPSAENVLKVTPKSERLAGNALFLSFGQSGTESSYIITEYVFDFYRRLREKGMDPYLPVIEPIPDSYRINKVALFDKNKAKIILSSDDTRVLNELLRQNNKFEVKVNEPPLNYVLAVQHFKLKYSIKEPEGEKPYIDMNIKVRGVAEQAEGLMITKGFKNYEQATSKVLEERYKNMLKKMQKLNVDPIGFGLHYTAHHYDQDNWKQWQALYEDLDFRVHVDVYLEGTGVLK